MIHLHRLVTLIGISAPLSAWAGTAQVAADFVNITSTAVASPTPSTKAAPYVVKGDVPEVIAISNGFVKIAYPNAAHPTTTGWIDSASLAGIVIVAPGAATDKFFLSPERKANTESNTPYVLGGQQITEISTQDSWSLVLYSPSRTLGWVESSKLKKTK